MTLIEFYPMLKVGSNGWKPDVDIFETKDNFVIGAEILGLKKKDIALTLEGDLLTLKGEKKIETASEKQNYQLNERRFGKFCRSFVIPDPIKPEKIKTSYKDGLLRISIPKPGIEKEREIQVEFK